jgi:hypothetical protein
MKRGQQQSAGADSTNFQAGGDIVYLGPTVTEIRDIALDVFKSNFLTLSGVAEQTARDRAERITREFLEELMKRTPGAINNVQDPDMLQAVYTAQKGYACSGEEDLESALVDLLVDRAGQVERNLKTLVLNEAIATLPKLTVGQREAITTCFLIRYTRYVGPMTLPDLYKWLDENIGPFCVNVTANRRSDYQHLQSVGAGALTAFQISLESALQQSCRGFFTNGFTVEQVPIELHLMLNNPSIFMTCIRDPRMLQINARSKVDVEELEKANGFTGHQLINLSANRLMSEGDIRGEVTSTTPRVGPLFDHWNSSGLGSVELTSAGIAIGHAYWQHMTSQSAPLDEWL